MTDREHFVRLTSWRGAVWFTVIVVVVFGLQMVVRWAWFKYQLVAFDAAFWIGMSVLFLALTAAGWYVPWQQQSASYKLKYSLLFGLVVVWTVGAAAYHLLNAVLDRGPASPRAYVVEERDCSRHWRRRGRTPARIVLRSAAGSDQRRLKLDVTVRVCRDAWTNYGVIVDVKPGFFGSPWVAGYTISRER